MADINATNPTPVERLAWQPAAPVTPKPAGCPRPGQPGDKQVWVEQEPPRRHELPRTAASPSRNWTPLAGAREDYFLRERAEDIAWHTEAIAGHHNRDKPLVLIRNNVDSVVANTTQIFIHARSHAQLFS